MDLLELERVLREKLEALGRPSRVELLHILTLPDQDRAQQIGDLWRDPRTRAFGELLIDLETDELLRAVLLGMLREIERGPREVG